MRHMELLYHFILETGPSLNGGRPLENEDSRVMMLTALSAPWLMYQLLALSAMHLSFKKSAEANSYREESTALQVQGLALYQENMDGVTAENCSAMLMFASLLSLHAFTEAVANSQNGMADFLDEFVTCLNLHRGVRVIAHQSWKHLLQSNMSSVLNRASQILDAAELQTQEQATLIGERLSRLLDQADMSEASDTACREAVSRLQLIYKSEPSARHPQEASQFAGDLIWVWPILLSGTFSDLLLKRQPEALIILCYYAVLLHHRRHLWLVGNGGRMLIEEITKSLGSYWRAWLDWPNEMLTEG